MSCSSDSEDENIKKLLEAADFTLINDALFSKKKAKAISVLEKPKSQRYLESDTDVKTDIYVSEPMQKFVSSKLSEIIAKNFRFVESNEYEGDCDTPGDTGGIKLLSDATDYIKLQESEETLPQQRPKSKKSRKLKMEDELNQTDLNSVVVDPNAVLSHQETKYWTNKPSAVVYRYKEKKTKLYEIEPDTEFTAARKKNNWDESKIRKR